MRRFCLLLLTLSLLAACDDGRQQRLQLEELERQNRADSLMLNDSLALALAEHFDHHGTPNEQLLAYYILGRTYADRGEVPQAIIAYNDAVDRADTVDGNCDYKTLCRVYAQMATVLYMQDFYREGLTNIEKAVRYGYLAKDTLGALMAYAQELDFYDMLNMPDSMFSVSMEVYEKLSCAGYKSYAAEMLIGAIRYLIDKGELSEVRTLMNRYEGESGFFDLEGNICEGREVYYYYKGLYHLKTCQYDSAEYYFRKELKSALDFNNQNAGAYGLTLLFQQTNNPDSAAKYAIYSYVMNDSAFSKKATGEVAKAKAFYDYSRYERQSKTDQQRAMSAQFRFIVSFAFAILLVLVAVILVWRYQQLMQLRKEEKRRYLQLQKSYSQTVQEIAQLRQSHQQLDSVKTESEQQATEEMLRLRKSEQLLRDLIEKKDEDLELLELELSKYKQKEQVLANEMSEEETLLRNTDFYKNVLCKTDYGKSLSESDWQAIDRFVVDRLPEFHRFIVSKRYLLTEYEYKMSMLVRLYQKPKSISNAMAIDGSYVTRVRRSMVRKLFGIAGNSKDADALVKQIDRLRPIL